MVTIPDPQRRSHANPGGISVNQEYIDEVLHAVMQSLRENQTLISRRTIEERIRNDPYLYPTFHTLSPISRRTKISIIMNLHFPLWIKGKGVHQNTYVWKVKDEKEE